MTGLALDARRRRRRLTCDRVGVGMVSEQQPAGGRAVRSGCAWVSLRALLPAP